VAGIVFVVRVWALFELDALDVVVVQTLLLCLWFSRSGRR
jgi:hypothetical protein